jgi:hypothetical protein
MKDSTCTELYADTCVRNDFDIMKYSYIESRARGPQRYRLGHNEGFFLHRTRLATLYREYREPILAGAFVWNVPA